MAMQTLSSGMVAAALFALAAAAAIRGLRARGAASALALLVRPVASPSGPSVRRSLGAWFEPSRPVVRLIAGSVGALVGIRLGGWPIAAIGAAAGVGIPVGVSRRRRLRYEGLLERQLAELAEACSLALRGGFSTAQALEIAADELQPPLVELVRVAVETQRLGTPLEDSLARLVQSLGTEDARLFGLVIGAHHKAGGNVSGALEEVAATIRHRVAVRTELRALTAQGRISGAILGTLPIGFFLVMAATSRRELAPVYHSPLGAGMVGGGLILDGLAYLWIRHLLRVQT